jgi:hypothetical protein
MEGHDKDMDIYGIPENIIHMNPVTNRDIILSFKMPYKTHLKMNKQPFWYLRKTFKRAYDLVLENDFDYKLIVLETHTKDFKNVFGDIDRFLAYLTKNYKNIEFVTTSEVVQHIEDGKLVPLMKK